MDVLAYDNSYKVLAALTGTVFLTVFIISFYEYVLVGLIKGFTRIMGLKQKSHSIHTLQAQTATTATAPTKTQSLNLHAQMAGAKTAAMIINQDAAGAAATQAWDQAAIDEKSNPFIQIGQAAVSAKASAATPADAAQELTASVNKSASAQNTQTAKSAEADADFYISGWMKANAEFYQDEIKKLQHDTGAMKAELAQNRENMMNMKKENHLLKERMGLIIMHLDMIDNRNEKALAKPSVAFNKLGQSNSAATNRANTAGPAGLDFVPDSKS